MPRQTRPLNPYLPMVDSQGRPTPFFMQWIQEQSDSNRLITDLSTPAAVSTVFDLLGDTWGSVLYRGENQWAPLAPGTTAQFLRSGGASANPQWSDLTFPLLTDTPANYSGAANRLVKVNAGASALEFQTLSGYIDTVIGSTRGSILIRGASGWQLLTPGTSGHVLTSNGAGADPSWQAGGGGGGGGFQDFAGFRALLTGNVGIGSGNVTIPFNTTNYDTDSAFNTSTNTYTAPAAHDQTFMVFNFTVRYTSFENGSVQIIYNGSTIIGYAQSSSYAGANVTSDPILISTGDTVFARVSNASGATVAASGAFFSGRVVGE